MGIIAWIILGLIAGWLSTVIMKTGETGSWVADTLLGIVGSIIGGFLMNMVGAQGVTGLNIYSIVVATLGAIVLIWIGRTVRKV